MSKDQAERFQKQLSQLGRSTAVEQVAKNLNGYCLTYGGPGDEKRLFHVEEADALVSSLGQTAAIR